MGSWLGDTILPRCFGRIKGNAVYETTCLVGLQDSDDGRMAQDMEVIDVSWMTQHDLANPRNWSELKKAFVMMIICFHTIALYSGPTAYTAGSEGIMEAFDVGHVTATTGLTVSLITFSLGSMLWASLSENPRFGRTSVIVATTLVYVVLSIPIAMAQNFGMLLAFRALAGFFGGSWSIGGSVVTDMYKPAPSAYPMSFWDVAGYAAPFVGALLGGLVFQYGGWRWPLWTSMWLAAAALILTVLFLPETSGNNILHRRAKQVRKMTGNVKIRAKIGNVAPSSYDIAVWPFVLLFTEPIALFVDLYIGLANVVAYLWLESFPLVFEDIYGFSSSGNAAAYLGLIVGGVVTLLPLCLYLWKYQVPMFRQADHKLESRLPAACVGSILMPISLFWFGWCTQAYTHWILVIVGSSLFGVAEVLLYASIYPYLTDLYPDHAASVISGNVFLRSIMAAAFPLVGRALYQNLGIGWASSLLGFVSCLFIPLPFVLYYRGEKLRRHSKRAVKPQREDQ